MPMHSQPIYKQKGDYPITEYLHNNGVCLPSAPSLSDNEIVFICQKINKFYGII